MEITDVRATIIRGNSDWPIVRIDTDQGICGYGEVRNFPRDAKLCYAGPKGLVLELKSFLIGEDPTDVEGVMQKLWPFGGPARLGGGVSAVEMALWDITGKAYGVPVWKLLGGKLRDEVKFYCDCHAGKPIGKGGRGQAEGVAVDARGSL